MFDLPCSTGRPALHFPPLFRRMLLAELQLAAGQAGAAAELARRALLYNKACGRAEEVLGRVAEREADWAAAAARYEAAWGLDPKPALGYRLAFNLMKGKRAVEAIDVCNAVLKRDPAYPRIKADILDKARALLRP